MEVYQINSIDWFKPDLPNTFETIDEAIKYAEEHLQEDLSRYRIGVYEMHSEDWLEYIEYIYPWEDNGGKYERH